MSQLYLTWFKMCYNNEPPTVSEAQLLQAIQRGMITEAEHREILDSKTIIAETTPTPTPPTEPTTDETTTV